MKRFKPGWPVIAGLLLAALLGLGVWLVQHERRETDRALSALRAQAAERARLLGQVPALSAENEEVIAQEVADGARILAALRTTMPNAATDRLVVPPPVRSVDAFFAIATFVESTRGLLAAAGIGADPGERFGFSSYSSEGPATDLLPVVHRQRLLVEQLVGILVAARPRQFLGIRREQVGIAPPPEGKATGDFFVFAAGLHLRQPGQLETAAFRVEFSGQTSTLRDFLNRLAADARPFVVRSVEVEALAPADLASPSKEGAVVPLVRPHFSKFAVIVECVSLPAAS